MTTHNKIIAAGMIVLLIGVLCSGCIQQSSQNDNYGDEVQFINLDMELCIDTFNISNSGKTEFVINSNEDFFVLIKHKSSRESCTNFTLPEVNFSQYTLLGKYTEGSGCSIEFQKKVYRNDTNKTITYVIKVVTDGSCDMLGTSMNWVLIPKIPLNYTINFKVK
jgi:hypothetical protein